MTAIMIPAIVYASNSKPEVAIVEDEIPVHWTITDRVTDLTIESPENEIINYIRMTFPEQPDLAVAIAKAESQLNTMAHGDRNNKLATKGSHGIFQINVAVHEQLIGDRNVNDWKQNIEIAREIYDQAGSWNPWGVFTNGSYLRYML